MPAPASLAEHYRAHRAAFALALELGITPRAAQAELRHREARERRREAQFEARRAAAAMLASQPGAATMPITGVDPLGDRPAESWMMRD